MNANKHNDIDTMHNQEAYEGIQAVMLKEEVIPKEIIKYSKAMQEKKRLEELQSKIDRFGKPVEAINNFIEAFGKQYPALSPIITPIKIIVKRVDGMFKIIDLILEYRLNGEEGILVKIGEETIASVVFAVGATISSIIATKVALTLSMIDEDFGVVVGFFIFSSGVIISDWLADKSKELVHFAFECIYLPAKQGAKRAQNGTDYFLGLGKDWFEDFLRITSFGKPETKEFLEYELRNKYSDDEVDDMDEFEKNYRILLGR